MADHVYKLSEVPKGERFAHFIEYYSLKTICIVLLVIFLISVLSSTLFAKKADINVLVGVSNFLPQEMWDEFEAAIIPFAKDYNGDKDVYVELNVNTIDESTKADPQQFTAASQRFMSLLTMSKHFIQVVDDEMFEYLLSYDLVGTYKEFENYNISKDENELVKIPISEVKSLDGILTEYPKDLYITIRSRESSQLDNKKKRIENYENHIKTFAELVGFEEK